MNKNVRPLLLAAAFALITAAAGSTAAQARPTCTCPEVFAPVICSNGVTYSNSCFAGCAGATGCVPANAS